MREIIHTSIMDDDVFLSFVGGDEADVGRKRIGNMYVSASSAHYSNYASRIKFTTDEKGAAHVFFDLTHVTLWDGGSSNPSPRYLGYNGNTTYIYPNGTTEKYDLTEYFKFAIVTEEQKDALIEYTASHWADSGARANNALNTSGYIVKNQAIKIKSAEGRVDNNNHTTTATDAKNIASFYGSCDILLEPNTTYYIWLYSNYDQTFIVIPFLFSGDGNNGQVIVSLDGAYGPHWMESSLYFYANNQWNSIN